MPKPRPVRSASTRSSRRRKRPSMNMLSRNVGLLPPKPKISVAHATTLAKRINFRSIGAVEGSLKSLKIQGGDVAPLLGQVYKTSRARALTLSKAILRRQVSDRESELEGRALIHWGRTAGPQQRRMVCTAFKQSKMNVIMVHSIAELAKKDARAYMKDYFAAGGDLNAVMEWLQIAGQVLRRHHAKTPNTEKKVVKGIKKAGSWVKDKVEDAVDAVGDMVNAVVDAVKAAGKSLGSALRKAVNWAADKLADLARALIEAGRKVAEILGEAARLGASALKKFVKALVRAGRSVGEILAWAASKAASTIRHVLRALLEAGKRVGAILGEAVKRGVGALRQFVKSLLQLGRRIGEIISWAASKAASVIQHVARALLEAGQRLGAILSEAVRRGIGALKQFVKAVIRLGKAIRDILLWVGSKVLTVVQHVMRALLEAGKRVAQIMAEAVKATASALRRIVQALYRIGRRIGEILVNVVRSLPSIIRTVLQGLFAIGVQLGQAVISICRDIGEGFRKGFFQGLLALGKAPLQIVKAALKGGGAILGLAVAVLMEIWGGHRPLTAAERAEARKVFGWSIDLNRVKIAVSSIPADVANFLNNPRKPGSRPFTTMYIINFASWVKVKMGDLIHELTHVWQAVVAGPVYMVEALHSQFFGRGYNVTDQDLAKAAGKLSNLEREQQAVVVERYWRGRWGGESWDWAKYQPLARQVFKPQPRRVPARVLRLKRIRPVLRRLQPQVVR